MVAPPKRNPYTSPRPGARPGSRPLSAAQIYRRPGVISLLAILQFVSGPAMVLIAGLILVASFSSEGGERALMSGVGGFYVVLGVLSIFCGVGLWKLKRYGRTLQIVFACIGLLAIPVGTLISALILVYLAKPGVKVLFSETPPAQLSAAQVADVAKLSEGSGASVAIIAVVVLFGLVAFMGIIAAIAIPSLLRARISANESQAIGDLRTIISAEAAYASRNGGYYDRLECLAGPVECLVGYGADEPVFLSEVYPAARSGYNREFHAGPPADTSQVAFANLSPSSVQSFAYLAYPVSPSTGSRGFCADHTGLICVTLDGSRPQVIDGKCDPACTPLQ